MASMSAAIHLTDEENIRIEAQPKSTDSLFGGEMRYITVQVEGITMFMNPSQVEELMEKLNISLVQYEKQFKEEVK